MTSRREPDRLSSRSRGRGTQAAEGSHHQPTGVCLQMDQIWGYAHRPFPFVLRYLRRRPTSHLAILAAVIAAVACSVGTQYGVKSLGYCLAGGLDPAWSVWVAVAFFCS